MADLVQFVHLSSAAVSIDTTSRDYPAFTQAGGGLDNAALKQSEWIERSEPAEVGFGAWGAGPTAVLLKQDSGWTYGALVNHVWSYEGWGDNEVNATFLQPFVTYTTKTFTTFGVNTESTYDWQAHQWSVPLNFSVAQLLKLGNQPVQFTIGGKYYADSPEGGPD